MYADELLRPWFDHIARRLDITDLFDCHNHVGMNDPSGFTATVEELEGSLAMTRGRSVVMPAAEPDGYAEPNKQCAAWAARSRTLTALARLTPTEHPADMLTEALASGARGVKLHGSSDEFDLEDPRLAEVYRIADREHLPVLVHAGPELTDVAAPALRICHRYPGLRLILAHCALTDLGWIWKHVPETPNLFFDTAWWTPAHLMALFRLVPPGRVLLGSDLPYATPLSGALATLRCAWQSNLSEEQIRSVAGEQFQRLIDAEEPADAGPPPARERQVPGPVLEILSSTLLISLEPLQRGESPGDPLKVARRACDVAPETPDADVIDSVRQLLDLYEQHHDRLPRRNQYTPGWDLIAAAAMVARTPAAGCP